MFERNWLVFEWFLLVILVLIETFTVVFVFKHIVLCGRDCFANDYVVTTYLISRTDNSISIKFFICSMLEPASFLRFRDTNSLHIPLGLRISAVEHTTEEATVNSRLIQHNWVLLVVATVTSNRNYTVTSSSQLFKSKVFHTSRSNKRFLRVIQKVSQCVHSHLVVRGIYSHSLFPHSTLITISWWLIMVREGDNWGANTQNHRWMNFTMSVSKCLGLLWIEIFQLHRNHGCFLFFDIQKFN